MYKPQEVRIVPGGLNLLAPGDALPAGDCLDLTGWWAGAAGRLEQAPGYATTGIQAFGVQFNGVCQSSGRSYGSGGGSLYQDGRGLVDSGFDSYPLGMLGFQGYLWAMNRGKQRKDNGSTVTDWTPAAPGVPALTNPALASAALTITELDPANADATSGQFSMIRMWTSSSIAGLEVGALMTINTAGAATAFDGTWQVTDIFDGSPSSLIQMSAKVAAGTHFSVAGGMTATFANPSMPMGDYQYWVTWQYTDLGESNPSSTAGVITAATVSVPALGSKITVSIAGIAAAGIAAGAVSWNVYRNGPGLPSPYRVNGASIPIATTSYDDFGDAANSQDSNYLIESLGILMEGDHDPAPAARIVANQVFNGRILVANSADHPNRVWYTPALQPGFFRGSGNPQDGDWVDIGTDRGDEILYMAVKPGQVTVYRASSIWRILGDFGDANSRIDVVVPDFGVVGPRAVACTSLGDYFRAPEGIYKFNGDWAQPVSAKLDPIFRGIGTDVFGAESAGYRSNCALGFRSGRLWVSYTPDNGTFNSDSFILHVATDRWFSNASGGGAFMDTGTAFLAGGFNAVYRLESGFQTGVSLPILNYQSGYEDCGQPDHEKTWADLIVNHNTAGQSLQVRVRTNKSADPADTFDLDTTLTSTSLTKTVVPLVYPTAHPKAGLPIRSYNLSVRITGNGSGFGRVSIETPIILHYYLEARQARVFDTDETDHGMPGVVKTVDMVEFDIDSSAGPGVLQIYSDIPGGTMIPQLGPGLAIAQTTGRQTVRIVFPPLDGKLLRYVATTPEGFAVYGFRARVTPIGVYVDGSIFETWDTRPIPFAG